MGTTETLARWVVDTSYEQLPSGAIAQAKKSILSLYLYHRVDHSQQRTQW